MKQFNWEEFKDINNKIAVHCKTEEEAKDFCKQMHEHGMKWANGDSYLKKTNFEYCKDKTCYHGIGGYSDLDYALRNEYAILEWSDYMKKEFTKADLKDGMVVELRNGRRYILLGNKLLRFGGWMRTEYHTNNLCDRDGEEQIDIVKVFKLNENKTNDLANAFDDKCIELIWERNERNEVKRMTVEEMRVKLEELLEEKIEVEYKADRFEMIGELYCYCDSMNGYCRGCKLKSMHEKYGCNFESHSEDILKQCYEKTIAKK